MDLRWLEHFGDGDAQNILEEWSNGAGGVQ